ncbi:MAG TPA: helix-turn-helix domain-containing protein [Micavibrio sp.]|nr:helix-turn-helix domain-containing protein [Micavibrio sp.]
MKIMVTDRITVTLRALPREEKLNLAKIYKRMADDLLDQVREADKYRAHMARVGHRLDVRHGIPDAMIKTLQTFHSEADAVPLVAEMLKTTESNVWHHWKAHKRDEAREARLKRDREILKMARAGKNNAEIARRYKISRPYVSKIVTRYFRQTARYGDHSQS